MAIEEYDGVIINKVTLAKYKKLKAANQIITSQSYVITDLDKYIENDPFGMSDLSKKVFDTETQNTDGSFMIQIFKDETYSTLYTTLSLDFDELEKDMTFELPFTGWYLVRLGLNGDIIDDKLNVWKYFDRCAYSLNIKLVSNVLNHCEIENISITKTHKLPQRLASNSYYSTVYDDSIDNVETGFYIWATWNTNLQIISGDIYYYVFSNISCDDDTNERWGVQIAIAEASNLMYYRRLTDDQVWSEWKRLLNSDDANNSEAYWQVRTGRVIGNGEVLFFNTNKTNFSDVPLGNLFLQEEESGSSYYLKFLQENGIYKLVWYNTDGVYTSSDIVAYGYSIEQMIWNDNNSHALYTHTLVGDYAKISQVISNTTVIDSLCRLNNTNF